MCARTDRGIDPQRPEQDQTQTQSPVPSDQSESRHRPRVHDAHMGERGSRERDSTRGHRHGQLVGSECTPPPGQRGGGGGGVEGAGVDRDVARCAQTDGQSVRHIASTHGGEGGGVRSPGEREPRDLVRCAQTDVARAALPAAVLW